MICYALLPFAAFSFETYSGAVVALMVTGWLSVGKFISGVKVKKMMLSFRISKKSNI